MSDKQRFTLCLLLCIFVLLAVRQHFFVDRYAVDVFYWDSWDLYHTMFSGRGWWAAFDLQHGPHRQGLGGLLMRGLAQVSHWNSRWDAFSVSFILIAATPLGVWLAFRCGVRNGALLIVPLIYLNIRQCHMFIASSNPAHGALPMLLFTLYCLALFVKSQTLRLMLICGLTFLLIFTGFGFFVGLITPVLLLVELVRCLRSATPHRTREVFWLAMALLATAASWTAFSNGYHFDPAVEGFRFPSEHPVDYLLFVGAMFGNFFGLDSATPLAVGVGLVLFAALVVICIRRFALMIRHGPADPGSAVVFSLAAFALSYSIDAAIGRVVVGWQTGALSRYVTLMIPMALALLIEFSAVPALANRRLPLVFGVLLALGTFVPHQADLAGAQFLHDSCLNWRAAYLQTHDQAAADRLAHFPIYPGNITNRLHYLQVLKLNLFDPTAFSKPAPTGQMGPAQ